MNETLVGKLLVASTLVPESVFSRSVCLMVHHDQNGAIGMLLNRPVVAPPAALIDWLADSNPTNESTAAELAEEDDEDPSPTGMSSQRQPKSPRFPQSSGPETGGDLSGGNVAGAAASAMGLGMVHFGGPVSGPVVAIHGQPAFAEAEAGAGIYVATQRQILEKLLKHPSPELRLVIGHAAWTNAQLAQEFASGLWHVLPATPETVLPTQVDPWPRLLRRATGASVAAWLGVADNHGQSELN